MQAQFDEVTPCDASTNPVVFGPTTTTISLSADFDPLSYLTPFVTDNAGGVIQNFGCAPGDSALFFKLDVDPNTRYLELEYIGGEPDVSVALVQILDAQCPSGSGTAFQESVYLDEIGDPMSDCAFDATGTLFYSFCNSTTPLDETTLYLWVSTATGDGVVDIDVTQYVAPANDACADAADLGTLNELGSVGDCNAPGGVTFTTEGACGDFVAGNACYNGFEDEATVWYTFTTGPNVYEVSIDYASFSGADMRVALFQTDCTTPTLLDLPNKDYCDITAADFIENIPVLPNATYHIAVSTPIDVDDWEGDFTLCIEACESPLNDEICDAEVVTFATPGGTGTPISGTTECASIFNFINGADTVFAECDNGTSGEPQRAVFYKLDIDPYATKIQIYGAEGSATGLSGQIISYDETLCPGIPTGTDVSIYTAPDFPDAFACGDFDGGQIELNLCNVDNADYDELYLVVYSDLDGGGTFDLNFVQEIAPYNDECDDPSDVSRAAGDLGVIVEGDNICAAATLGGPQTNRGACPDNISGFPCFDAFGDGDQAVVWYTFETGDDVELMTVNVEHLESDQVRVAMFEMDIDCDLATVAPPQSPTTEIDEYCTGDNVNDGVDSLFNVLVKRNTRYYIVVSTDTTEWGEFDLCIKNCPAPLNDTPCDAITEAEIMPGEFPDYFIPAQDIMTTQCANNFFGDDLNSSFQIGNECYDSDELESSVFYKIDLDENATEFLLFLDNVEPLDGLGAGLIWFDGVDPCDGSLRTGSAPTLVQDADGNSIHDCSMDGDTLKYDLCGVDSVIIANLYVWVSSERTSQGPFQIGFSQKIGPPHDECEDAEDLTMSTNLVYDEMTPTCFNRPEIETTLYGCEDEVFAGQPDPECLDLNQDVEYSVVWYKFTTDDGAGEVDLFLTHDNPNLENDDLIITVFEFDQGEECDVTLPVSPQECVSDENGDGIIIDETQNIGVLPNTTYYIMVMTPKDKSGTFELCMDIDPPKPCDEDPPRYYNHTAPICGLSDLDGACLKLTGIAQKPYPTGPLTWPGCGGSFALHNPNWVTFVAGSNNITLDIIIDACQNGGGAQVAVYGPLDCALEFDTTEMEPGIDPTADQLLSNCSFVNCQQGNIVFDVNTIPGEIYGIVFDGCNGDICDVSIEVEDGGDAPSLDGTLEEPVFDNAGLGPDSLCEGATTIFSLENEIQGACATTWELVDDMGNIVYDTTTTGVGNQVTSIEYTFDVPGEYELCVVATNLCDETDPTCIPIIVFPLETIEERDTICEGGDMNSGTYVWDGPLGNPVTPNNGPIDVFRTGLTRYTGTEVNALGCEVEVVLDLFVIDENEDNRTPIDTFACYQEIIATGFLFGAEGISCTPTPRYQSGVYDEDCVSDISGCDTFFTVTLNVLGGAFEVSTRCLGDGTVDFFFVDPQNGLYTPWAEQYQNYFSQPDFDVVWTWTVENNANWTASDTLVNLTQNEIINLADNGVLTMELRYSIFYQGQEICSSTNPAEFEYVLENNFPQILYLDGDTTFCEGQDSIAIWSVFQNPLDPDPNGDPDPVFLWLWNEPNGFTVLDNSNSSDTIKLSVPEPVNDSTLCLSVQTLRCGFVDTLCQDLSVDIPDQPVVDDPLETCDTFYTFAPTLAQQGGWRLIDTPASGNALTFDNPQNPNATVSVTEPGTYVFEWQEGPNSCAKYDTTTITFLEHPFALSVEDTCYNGIEFEATVTINGGSPAYTIHPNSDISGSINGNTFVSDVITVDFSPGGNFGDVLYLVIQDANGCISDSIPITIVCECDTEAGDMATDTIEVCEDETAVATYLGGHVNDGNDTLVLILHSGDTNELVNIIDTTVIGGGFGFIPGSMNFGQTYYISQVIGNATGANLDEVDLDDPCLAVSIGQPVIWYENPVADAGMPDTACGFTYTMMPNTSVGIGEWKVVPDTGSVFIGDPANPNTTITVVNPGTYTMRWTENNNGCVDSSDVEITLVGDINFRVVYECNGTATEYTAYIILSSGGGGYSEVNGKGTFRNDTLVSDIIPKGDTDTFIVNSVLGCGPDTIVVQTDCVCRTEIGTLDTSNLLSVCDDECINVFDLYDPTGENFDANDISNFIIHNEQDTFVGSQVYAQRDSVFCFQNLAGFNTGDTVYVSYVIGNPGGGGNVDLLDPCLKITYGVPVVFIERPVANAGADQTECGFDASLAASASIGTGNWVQVSGPGTSNFSDPTNPTSTVTVSDYGTYEFEWTEINEFCEDSDTVSIEFLSSPEVDPASVTYDCDNIGENFTATFNVDLGDEATLQVINSDGDPVGSFNGRQFTTDLITSDSTVTVFIFDANGCDTFELSLTFDCPCLTEIGSLDGAELNLCEDQRVTGVAYNPTGENLDGNDEIRFVLLDAADNQLDVRNNTNFTFDPNTMNLGETYFIWVYAGSVRNGMFDFNDDCLVREGPIEVTWWAYPEAMAVPSEDTITCTLTSIQIDGSSSVGQRLSYQWSTNDGGIDPTTANQAVVTVTSGGTYTLVVTDDLSGCTDEISITIAQSDDVPEAIIAQPAVLTCDVTEITIDGSGSTSGPSIQYTWSTTNGSIVGPNDGSTLSVNAPGDYTLTVFDASNSCEVSASVTVTEDTNPPAVSATVLGQLDCNTDEVTLSGDGSATGANITYTWSTSNGVISGSSNTINTSATSVGDYTLVVENADNGCVDSVTISVTRNPIELSDIIVEANDPICHDEINGIIRIQPVGGQEPILYRLVGVGENNSGVFTGLGPGVYDIEVIDANGCTASDQVELVNPPILTLDLTESLVIEKGDSVVVVATIPLGANVDTVIWDTDTVPFTCLDPQCLTIRITPPNTMVVSATALAGTGCSDDDAMKIIVRVFRDVYVPNIFSPNGDGINDLFLPMTGRRVTNINYMQVFDRWGNRMFESRNFQTGDLTAGWDGTFRGRDVGEGVFVYKVEVVYDNGDVELIDGTVTLVR